jgi:glutamine synthetase
MSDHVGTAHINLEKLRAMVRDGSVDTLIVALTDMQGRLMGKRV